MGFWGSAADVPSARLGPLRTGEARMPRRAAAVRRVDHLAAVLRGGDGDEVLWVSAAAAESSTALDVSTVTRAAATAHAFYG